MNKLDETNFHLSKHFIKAKKVQIYKYLSDYYFLKNLISVH